MQHVEVVSDREYLDVDVSKEPRLEAEVLDPGDRAGEHAGIIQRGLEAPGGGEEEEKERTNHSLSLYIHVCVCMCMLRSSAMLFELQAHRVPHR